MIRSSLVLKLYTMATILHGVGFLASVVATSRLVYVEVCSRW